MLFKKFLSLLILTSSFSPLFSMTSVISTSLMRQAPMLGAMAIRTLPMVHQVAARNFSWKAPIQKIVQKIGEKTQVAQVIQQLRTNPADRKMVAQDFAMNSALYTTAAFGASHALTTSTTATVALYGAGFAGALRTTFGNYRQFLQDSAIKRVEQKIDANHKALTTQIGANRSAIEATKSAVNNVSTQIITSSSQLHTRVNDMEGKIITDLSKMRDQATNFENTTSSKLDAIARQHNLTTQQLASLLGGQTELNENQKLLLEVVRMSLSSRQLSELSWGKNLNFFPTNIRK